MPGEQTMLTLVAGRCERLDLPSGDAEVAGVKWGRFDEVGTPAYWKGQCWQADRAGRYQRYRLGRSLMEETAACLLGGYGMPAEVGLAAFARIRDRGRLCEGATPQVLEADLLEPLQVNGRPLRYRFPRQKAFYLSKCIQKLRGYVEPLGDVSLRDDLETLPGIGPKTASGIVRNRRGSAQVAILDVHVMRSGRIMGIFADEMVTVSRYRALEATFLALARGIEVEVATFDNLLWSQMRILSGLMAKDGRDGRERRLSATSTGAGGVA